MMSSHSDDRKDLLDGWYPTKHFVEAVQQGSTHWAQAEGVIQHIDLGNRVEHHPALGELEKAVRDSFPALNGKKLFVIQIVKQGTLAPPAPFRPSQLNSRLDA